MTSGVFISYSRKDSEEALELAERLRAEGMTIWIDQHGIEGAAQWAGEIASAIRECGTLLLLVSENSTKSANVLKEVALASEKGKRILPVILRRTALPVSLEYHLAGIHHVHYSDFPSIVHSIEDLSSNAALHGKHGSRESLLVLPFEDLSPEQDNGWFADGLTSELITSLSKIKSLRVIDRNTAMDFKTLRGRTREIASDLDVRYFLEGNVRKFGDQIKISVELLDIESGDYLWHDAHKGTFSDIFEIQENMAKRVVEGLKLTLTHDEEKTIADKGTENAEAYELYLKALEDYYLWTRGKMLDAIALASHAIELDPRFAEAILLKGIALSNLYRLWDRDPKLLTDAEGLFIKAKYVKPHIPYENAIIIFYLLQHRYADAERAALKNVEKFPDDFYAHFMLGYFNNNAGRPDEAISAYEEAIRLRPDYRMSYWNLVEALNRTGQHEERALWSVKALPLFEKWLVLHSDDQFARAQYALLLVFAGLNELAISTIEPILQAKDADSLSLYTASTVFLHLEEFDKTAELLERAITAGFADIELLKSNPSFLRLDDEPKFKALLQRLGTPA